VVTSAGGDSLADLVRDQVDALAPQGDPAAMLLRQSYASLLHDLTGEDASGTRLELHFDGDRVQEHRAPAEQLYEVLSAFQGATALVGESLRPTVVDEPQRITDQRRGRHQLDVLAPAPGSLVLTVVPAPGVPDAAGDAPTTWAEMALAHLVNTLPDDDTLSEAAQGAILASNTTLRAGLALIARSVERTGSDLTMTLRRPARQATRARLGRTTARLVLALAEEPVTVTEHERHEGVLDGMRTRKRMFWLVLDSGEEISGGVPEHLLDTVRANMGSRVSADVDVTRIGPEGRLGRPRYVLRSIGLTNAERQRTLDEPSR
jgi:hypothetical protein